MKDVAYIGRSPLISLLSSLSKILERVILKRLKIHAYSQGTIWIYEQAINCAST
jgi:hypothetical protein